MNLEEKVKEISKEIESLKSEIESKTVRLKLLEKSLKQYNKLLSTAAEIDNEMITG